MINYRFILSVIASSLFVLAVSISFIEALAKESGASVCQSITFGDGSKISIRSDKIHMINAVLEWPAEQVRSVSIVLPSEPALAGNQIESIFVAPVPVKNSIDQQKLVRLYSASCKELKKRKGVTRCKVSLPKHKVLVSAVFNVPFSDALADTTEQLARYVRQEVLNCPRQ